MSGAGSATLDDRVRACVQRALDDLNAIRAESERLPADPELRLLGEGGCLDSLAFVNLVVSLDTALAGEFGPQVSVMGELLAAPDPGEFATVGKLVAFVARRTGATA